MLIIRLSKIGKKNNPFYRIVVCEKQRKVTGKIIQVIGFWDRKNSKPDYNKDLLNSWKEKGALISPSVKKLISI